MCVRTVKTISSLITEEESTLWLMTSYLSSCRSILFFEQDPLNFRWLLLSDL